MIPLIDVGATYNELAVEIDEAVTRVLSSGQYILGEEVRSFEKAWADYCGANHAVGVGNGLDAIFLALKALGIGPGDEVIVPAHTYIGTWLAVSRSGATIVPIEPNQHTYNLDHDSLKSALTSRTKAILPVHLYGLPAEMDEILLFARDHGLYVLEDAAQAHGATFLGRRIGSHGDAVAWSFYPSKNLGCFGDGGAVTTNNERIAKRIKLLRNYGSQKKNEHEIEGYNSRLDPIQAAILRVKLKRLDSWNQRRALLAQRYLKNLSVKDIQLPTLPKHCSSAWHLFVIRHDKRALLSEKLREANITSQIHYPVPPHQQPAYKGALVQTFNLPIAELMSQTVLSLPIGPHLRMEDVDYVVDVLNQSLG